MTISSRIEDGKKVYSFNLTEEEYEKVIRGEPIHRLIEWIKGKGIWVIKFTNIIGSDNS